MELETNTDEQWPGPNVHYIDEYPELKKRVWLRRLNAARQMGNAASEATVIIKMPDGPPDGAA